MSNISFIGKVDRNNIPEGFPAIATALWKNLRPFMWIKHGETCTVHTLSDTGEIQVPIFSPDSMGEITPLCDKAIPSTGKFETLLVRIDSNAATRMAGCFRSFGINDKQITAALMQANLGTLGLTLLKSFESELIAKGRRFAGKITYNTELTPLNIVSALESDFIHETGNTPTFMLVSKRMFDVLRAYVSERPTNLGDRTLVTGSVGVINNIDVIPTQITDADIIMMNKDSLRIVQPTKASQIRGFEMGIQNDNVALNLGVLVQEHQNPAGLYGSETWVYVPHGKAVVSNITLLYTVGDGTTESVAGLLGPDLTMDTIALASKSTKSTK